MAGKYRFGYLIILVSPETGTSVKWSSMYEQHHNVAFIAVDKAHCIEEWLEFVLHICITWSFLNDYLTGVQIFKLVFRELAAFEHILRPLLWLTATATPSTQKTIEELLHLKQPRVVVQPLDRPNIFYSLSEKSFLNVSNFNCAYDLQGAA